MKNLDEVVKQSGGFGPFQIAATIVSALFLALVGANMAASIFVAMIPATRCKSPYEDFVKENCSAEFRTYLVPEVNAEFSTCERYNFTRLENVSLPGLDDENFTLNCDIRINVSDADRVACTTWEFNRDVMRNTIVTDFNLVCADQWAGYVSQSSLMLGVGLGSIFAGYISDRIGRRHAALLSCSGMVVFGTALAFTESFVSFSVVRAIMGIFVYCPFMVLFVHCSELTIPRYRTVVAQILELSFPFGFMYLAGVAFVLREWRHVQLVISVPFVLGILMWWFMPESPRWLCQKGRYSDAKIVLQRVARLNRTKAATPGNGMPSLEIVEAAEHEIRDKTSLKYLFRQPHLRSATLIMFFNWFAVSCVYYGLTLNVAELDGDPFRNLCYNSLAEVFAVLITIPLANSCGRRATGSAAGIMAGVMCVLVTLVPSGGVLPVATLGKFAISISFSVMYIFASEIYPTVVRNLGIGLCSAMARLGGVVSPLVAMLGIFSKDAPYIVLGILPILSAILILTLPETKGTTLPQTMQEGEKFVQNDRGILKLFRRQKANGVSSNP